MLKRTLLFFIAFLSSASLFSQVWHPNEWPVLKHYDQEHLLNIALPLGGIGTGTVSLGGRGELRDWEVMNYPAIGYSTITDGNNAPFFAIHISSKNKKFTKALIGPIHPTEYKHFEGRPINHHGLPRFKEASFDAAYPFGCVNLKDPELPVTVKIKGFNPLIPGETDNSSYPVAVLSYEVTNTSNIAQEVSICGSARNFIGRDGSKMGRDWKGDFIPQGAKENKNVYKQTNDLKGIYMYSQGVDSLNSAFGNFSIITPEVADIFYRTASRNNAWENSILSFWDEFSSEGILTEQFPITEDDPMASLGIRKTIAPHSTQTFTFYLSWYFPNRYAWSRNNFVGNYYTTKFNDSWQAAEELNNKLPALEKKTLQFVNSFLSSSYPDQVKEAALFNISVLRSQTVFIDPQGHMLAWEGVMDYLGSCYGSCTHVWNYETTTPFLFGDLARTMRDVEFGHATDSLGYMNFRINLPLTKPQGRGPLAADGQMGTIMKFYREWQLSGDSEFLKNYYPAVKRALSYAWIEKGWDANKDGVMEGSQHNTMDVNYFGPNPQMGFWYLGALRAMEEMAKAMDDLDFAEQCHDIFSKGSKWIDENLFNGEYYEQKITDPETFEFINIGNPDANIPEFQLGSGCLVDQLVGQYMAHICGLGYLADKNNIIATLRSIMKYNYLPKFENHFNNMRSYVMGNEAGLLMGAYPKNRLEVPFPYFNEAMTGFEYTAATNMLQEGMKKEGELCIKNIRDRFDGLKRNPFDEVECGHHYGRSMASWSTVLALSGFNYSAVDKSISFTNVPGSYFWSNGSSWGMAYITKKKCTIEVLNGKPINLNVITVGDKRIKVEDMKLQAGQKQTVKI
ncbi:MAG: GH116 family glycosyl-hydrolase [Bacteroidales bacterium]|nr:GH116 family glycosyl-hydrolase [Bacteroidales bacterium]